MIRVRLRSVGRRALRLLLLVSAALVIVSVLLVVLLLLEFQRLTTFVTPAALNHARKLHSSSRSN